MNDQLTSFTRESLQGLFVIQLLRLCEFFEIPVSRKERRKDILIEKLLRKTEVEESHENPNNQSNSVRVQRAYDSIKKE